MNLAEMGSKDKGLLAATAIRAELLRFAPDITAGDISEQCDPNHWDINVTIKEESGKTGVKIQAKWLSNRNTRLQVKHIDDWLRAQSLTIPVWWDEGARRASWCDIFTVLVQDGGVRGRESIDFKRAFIRLDAGDQDLKRSFLTWVRTFAKIWPLQYGCREWLLPPEFPVNLTDVLRHPDLLAYLPVNGDLVTAIRNRVNPPGSRNASLTERVFHAGEVALKSPERAVIELAKSCGIAESEVELRKYLTERLRRWSRRIGTQRVSADGILKAFQQLVGVMCYERPGDVRFPKFAAAHTYPLSSLVQLLPARVVAEQTAKILESDNDPNTLLFATHTLGLAGLRHEPAVIANLVRETRLRVKGRAGRLGPQWPIVDRQLLYTEAQLGNEESRDCYLRALRESGGLGFDVPFNYCYYDGDLALIEERFERRLEDNLASDRATRDILHIQYQGLRNALKARSPTIGVIRPELWPVR